MKFDLQNVEGVMEDLFIRNSPDIDPFDDKITSKF